MSDFSVPAFTGNINFNAQHSPMGAFMSFTCGNFAAGGGIGVEIGKPADQNVFIGVKDGPRDSKAPVRCLPFAKNVQTNAAADFQVEQAQRDIEAVKHMYAYGAGEITRQYGWGTDTWVAPDFSFTIHTPFGPIPDPQTAPSDALREALLPAILATFHIDNRTGTSPKTAVFAIRFQKQGARIIGDGNAVGFACKREVGVLAKLEGDEVQPAPFPIQRWSMVEALSDVNTVHALGNCAGVAVEVPAGTTRTLTIAVGCYLDGVVTTGLEGRYFYTRYYGGLLDVLSTALATAGTITARARQLDAELASSGLSPDQQFLIAHSTRSYYGSTQLLDVAGEPFWVVNEGEYCMMNTLDLSVDQMFWELDQNPWVVRNLLDSFSRRYSYIDELQAPGERSIPGGLSFTHDMGVHNNFSPPGYSSYELGHLTGCFGYMTAEQLCNWSLMAVTYLAKTGDDAWLRQNASLIRACLDSLIARGGKSGSIEFDSTRCEGGQEITTYDSLDTSLAQTRNNVYMAVKCWATYLGLALLSESLGDDASAATASEYAQRVADSVVAHAGVDGVIPAVFEPDSDGYSSRILPAAEGLMYPQYWHQVGFSTARLGELLATSASQKLRQALDRHTQALLLDPEHRNIFPDGGIRLSSTSGNSWMSKIAIFQHVARAWFNAGDGELAAAFAKADAAHVGWQTNGSAFWACSDQFVHGEAKGSRYYPRIITTALWLNPPSGSLTGDRSTAAAVGARE